MQSFRLFLNLILILVFFGSIFLIWLAITIHNSLIFKKNQVDRAFSSIDILLKKRCDLIPNLVAVVKKYMQFEQKTLAEITRLRSRVVSGQVSEGARVELENQISRVLGNILTIVENYPELKANQNFIQLQQTILEIEEQISAARRFYNSAVTDYNNAIEMFPSSIVASQMNYRLKKLFEANEQERRNVNVNRLFES